MKKLGLIGGTGPESTIEYYKRIEYAVQKTTGKFPELIIESLSVFDVLRFCEERDYDGLTRYLLHGFECLANGGADFACLTGITPHVVFDQISEKSPIPVVSMVETSSEKAGDLGYKRVALLGTYPTMSGSFFQRSFAEKGITVITPSEEEMRYIGDKIQSELELGKVLPETQKKLIHIGNRLIEEENVQALILGCTELPMILKDGMFSAPCFDVMQIHIDKLVSLILE